MAVYCSAPSVIHTRSQRWTGQITIARLQPRQTYHTWAVADDSLMASITKVARSFAEKLSEPMQSLLLKLFVNTVYTYCPALGSEEVVSLQNSCKTKSDSNIIVRLVA